MRARTFSIGKRRTSYSRNRTGWRTIAPGIGQWTPGNLNPYAWYDAHLGGTSTEITDSSANSRAALAFAAGSNSPLILPYAGAAYVYIAGGRFSTASSAVYDVTDFDMWTDISSATWTTTFPIYLAERFGGAPNVMFRWTIGTDGKMVFLWSTNGTATVSHAATTAIATVASLSGGERVAFRVTLDTDNGAGGYGLTFYYRVGGYDGTWTTWETFTGGSTTTIATGVNRQLEVAASGNNFNPSTLYGFEYLNGIGGSVLAEVKPANMTQTAYTDGAGRVWTLTRSTAAARKTVVLSPAAGSARGVALFGTDDYAVMPAAAMPDLGTDKPATLVVVKRSFATIATGDRLLDSRADTTDTTLGLAMHHDSTTAASFRVGAGDGTNTAGSTLTSANISGRRTAYAAVLTPTQIQAWRANSFGTAATRPALTISTGGDVQIGRNAGGTEYSDMELTAVLTFDRVLTAGELARIATYYQDGV